MSFRFPDVGESVIMAGNTRSGKTQLAKYFSQTWGRYFQNLIIDQLDRDRPRNSDSGTVKTWADYSDGVIPWKEATSSIMLQALRQFRIVTIDSHNCGDFKTMREIWGRICGVALSRGNTLVICDEIARVCDTNFIHPNHFLLITGRGDKRRCSAIQATQTPQSCHPKIRDNASHHFYFRLDERICRKYLASFMDHSEDVLTLPPYHSLHKYIGPAGKTIYEILKPCPLV